MVCTCDPGRTLQNYLAWMLIMERVSSMSRRFKDVRAHYRKVRLALNTHKQRTALVAFNTALKTLMVIRSTSFWTHFLGCVVCVLSGFAWHYGRGGEVERLCPLCAGKHGERRRGPVCPRNLLWKQQTHGKTKNTHRQT